MSGVSCRFLVKVGAMAPSVVSGYLWLSGYVFNLKHSCVAFLKGLGKQGMNIFI